MPQNNTTQKEFKFNLFKSAGKNKEPEFKPKKTVSYKGLSLAIENPKGSVRHWTDDDGNTGDTKMFHDYGYVKGTMGVDGDEVDVYLGPDKDSEKVFVIHQNDPDSGKYDEDKCMLSFSDWDHARDAYLAHYDSHGFLGKHTEMSFDEFKKKVLATKKKPGMLKAFGIFLFKGKQFDLFSAPKQEELFTGQEKDGKRLTQSKKNPQVRRWQSVEDKSKQSAVGGRQNEEKKLGLNLFKKKPAEQLDLLTELKPGMIRKDGDKEYKLSDDFRWEEVKEREEVGGRQLAVGKEEREVGSRQSAVGKENSENNTQAGADEQQKEKNIPEGDEKNHRVFIIHKSNKPTTEFDNITKEEAEKLYNQYEHDPDTEIITWDKAIKNKYGKIEGRPSVKMHVNKNDKKLMDDVVRKPEVEPEQKNASTLENIDSQVQQQLDEKQKNKEFKDVNERVPLSKKELAAFRKFTVDDLEKLDNASAFTLVKKDRIIPELDIDKMREDGEPAGLVYFKKKLRDLVGQKPANTEAARKLYVEKLPGWFEIINKAQSTGEILKYFRGIIAARYKSYRSSAKTFVLDKDENYKDMALEEVFGKPFLNFVTATNNTAKEQIALAQLMNKMTIEESHKIFENKIKDYDEFKQKRIEKYKNMSDAEWGSELMSQFGFGEASYLKEMGITYKTARDARHDNPEAFKKMTDQFKDFRIRQAEETEYPYKNYDEFIKKYPQYAPRENNWGWLENVSGKSGEVDTEMRIHDNPPLAYIKRQNGREVLPDEIKPETITSNLGFKSVQIGNYVKDKEAKEHIKHFIGAIKDMEDALGIDMRKLNEAGGLSLAFGARGSGRALAHYEPNFKIINITKARGDGSISHEWGHFLDHFIGGGGLERNHQMYASHQAESGKHDSDLLTAVGDVYRAMTKGEGYVKKTFQPEKRGFTWPKLKSIYQSGGLTAAKDFLEQKVYSESDRKVGYEILAGLKGGPIEVEVPRRKSNFLEGAQSFKSAYWSRPTEMFARALEAYVYDKLEQKEMYNNYLVGGNKLDREDMKWNPASLSAIYPQGEERTRINASFDKLMDVLKKNGYEKKYEYPEPRTDEFVDLVKSIEADLLFEESIERKYLDI